MRIIDEVSFSTRLLRLEQNLFPQIIDYWCPIAKAFAFQVYILLLKAD